MLQARRKVLEYARDLDESGFLASSREQDAILRQLTILGEAAKQVSAEFRATSAQIPWRKVVGFRDVLIHGYFRVDLKEVWRIVREDVPPLTAALEQLVPPEDGP